MLALTRLALQAGLLAFAPPVPDAAGEAKEPSAVEAEAEAATGDTATVVGHLAVKGAVDPVVAARIVRVDGGEAVVSDEAGDFELSLSPGEHELLIRAEGYRDLRTTVTLAAGEELVVTYRLERDLDGVGYRTVVETDREVAVSRTTLQGEEIYDVPGSRGDPFRVVTSMPGASQVAGFLPYVVVRGAAPGNTGYYLDGVRVPLLFHVAAGPSVVHPHFIDAVDFYPSGAPVRLGRFASGIVEGRTRPARRDRIHGDIDLRITDTGAMLEFPLSRPKARGCTEKRRRDCPRGDPRGSLTVAGRYSYTGLLLSLIPALNVRLQFWDFQGRFDHDLGPRSNYRAFAYGAYDSFGPREVDPATLEEGEEASGRPDPVLRFEFYRLDQRITTRLRGGGQARYQLALGFDNTGVTEVKNRTYRIMPRVGWVLPVRPGIDVGFGLDQEVAIFRVPNALTDIEDVDTESVGLLLSDRTVSSTALWTDLRLRRGDFEARPGLRLDFYAQFGRSPYLPDARAVSQAFGVDPRVLFRERVAPRWVLRQSVGMYHQPPDSPVPVPGLESIGFDRGLQRNIQGSFGYEFQLADLAMLSQEIYAGYLDGLQDYELAQVSEGSNEIEDFIVSIDGYAFGLETMLKLDPTLRVYGWAAYTLSRSMRNFDPGGWAPGAWDQTHILNVVLGYRISDKWRVGGRVHFNTGRPFTPLLSSPDPAVSDLVYSFEQNRNGRRLPAFFQFDARVERIWTYARWQLHLYLDVVNANLSTEIFQCGGAETGGSGEDSNLSSIPGCVPPTGIPYILPSLGLRGTF